MRKLLVVILIAITFSSCEYFLGGGITVEPKVYMVAIGIGYEHSADISRLKYTKSDMNALSAQIANLLEGKMDYEILTCSDEEDGLTLRRMTSGGERETLYVWENGIVDTKTLSMALDNSLSKAEDGDVMIFYYAGHGDDETGCLAYTYEYGTNKYETISVRDLYDDMLSRWKGRKLLLLDSCFSGNFIENGDLAPTHTYDEKGNLTVFNPISSMELSWQMLKGKDNAKPDVYVISGASRDQMTYEGVDGIEHGLFTYALLRYLDYDTQMEEATYTTKFDGKYISVSDLYNGIIDNFPNQNYFKRSTPNTTPSRFDMILFDFR